jgi:multidrug transporter EmrE-like cation transporter
VQASPYTLLVILLGILSSTQIHLAKALERQGIEVFDQLRLRFQGKSQAELGGLKKPFIYSLGLFLNFTVFIYAMFVVPLGGTTALFTSMYGMGLVALLGYSAWVMKEHITRLELIGCVAIMVGTLVIGVENIYRPAPQMSQMSIAPALISILILLSGCIALVVTGQLRRNPNLVGLTFGLAAGILGCLDPFLKGLSQAAGGADRFLPQIPFGWIILVSSFLVGQMAMIITQWGFIHRARANSLVPAYNCSYIIVPILLQALHLPGYTLYFSTLLGLGLIIAGIVTMRAFTSKAQPSHPTA